MTCPHCGDEHGPSACRAELQVKLAEANAANADIHIEIASLRLEVASLRHTVVEHDMARFGPWQPPHGA